MQNVDLAYLVNVGARIRTLLQLNSEQSSVLQYGPLTTCQQAIQELVFGSVYSAFFRPSLQHAATKFINELQQKIETVWPTQGGQSAELNQWEISALIANFSRFEAVLESELQSVGGFIVTQKSGFDISSMVYSGHAFFPTALESKVPEALGDIGQAMKCIAFELPTAAGFHLHRANEAVLRRYWDGVTSGETRPKNGNMGVYLSKLREKKVGRESTLNQLQSLKDFHRNPLMHPEQSLDSVDASIDLMAAIRCSIGYMLDEI